MSQQQQQPNTALQSLRQEMELSRPSFDKLNLTGLSFAKEIEFACQLLAKNTYLLSADKNSLRDALVNVALTGLSLSPVLKYAYLVPRKARGAGLQCVVDPSYMGLCKILTDTGSVTAISAHVVYEREVATLDIEPGAGGHAKYKPYTGSEDLGKPAIVYSVAVLPSGIKHVEFMRKTEWEAIMKRSESYKNYIAKLNTPNPAPAPTWVTDEGEMIRKTCIKRHYKYLPKTEQAERIAAAIELDNQANGIDFENQNNPNAQQTQPAGQAPQTPEAPPQEALATYDDMKEIEALIQNPALGNFVFGNIQKPSFINAVAKKYNSGSLEKAKAESYIKGLKEQIQAAEAAAQQQQQPAGQETAQEGDY